VRDLTLRAQFHDFKLPLAPSYFIAEPDHLPEPYGPKRPLKLLPGNFIATRPTPSPKARPRAM
jgi:hypothetical protein